MFPGDLPTVQITDVRTGPGGEPATGTLTITPETAGQVVTAAADGHIVQGPVRARWVDGVLTGPDGEDAVTLLAADADGIEPQGWTYRVVERPHRAPGRSYPILVTTALGATVSLAELAPVVPSLGEYVTVPGPAGPEGPEGPEGAQGDTGPEGAPGADGTDGQDGADAAWPPARQGYTAWSINPDSCSTTLLLPSGRLFLEGLYLQDELEATALDWYVTAGASSPTAGQCWIGLYAQDGTRLAAVDAAAAMATVGAHTTPLAHALPSGLYWAAILFNGGSGPQIPRGTQAGGGPGLTNINLPATAFRCAFNGDGHTDLPAAISPAANEPYIPLFAAIR